MNILLRIKKDFCSKTVDRSCYFFEHLPKKKNNYETQYSICCYVCPQKCSALCIRENCGYYSSKPPIK